MRGFITTPLERAIAAADGIDYIESQSVQGLSTINVRLKLNFNAANALADISARVNQVRADLPPEAQVPAIQVEPSDAQVAAMYLELQRPTCSQDNQVTDYLIRVVQPRLSAIAGVQRAEILGGADVRAARLAEAGSHGGAERHAVAGAAGARRQQLPHRPSGTTKGALTSVERGRHRPTCARWTGSSSWSSASRTARWCACEDVADVVLGADEYDQDVRFSGQKAVFMGVWVLPERQRPGRHRRRRRGDRADQRELPTGHAGEGRLRLDRVHRGRDPRGRARR